MPNKTSMRKLVDVVRRSRPPRELDLDSLVDQIQRDTRKVLTAALRKTLLQHTGCGNDRNVCREKKTNSARSNKKERPSRVGKVGEGRSRKVCRQRKTGSARSYTRRKTSGGRKVGKGRRSSRKCRTPRPASSRSTRSVKRNARSTCSR